LNKRIKLHVYGTVDQSGLKVLNASEYISNMVATYKKPTKLLSFNDEIEYYHFYFNNLILYHLVNDQQQEKDPKL
jgi:hypothetical protein